MVKLELKSQISQKEQPFLYNWDQNYRVSHSEYQYEIDKVTSHLQRSQRSLFFLGQWVYPRFFQKDILNLEVLLKKQWLGKINQDEVENFKRFNPEIAQDLNKTFSAQWIVPKTGFAVGLGGFAFGALFNYRYSYRLGFFLVPVLADFSLQLFDKKASVKALEFMDWALQYRTQRARQEIWANKNEGRTSEFKGNVWDSYSQVVDLVQRTA